MKKIFFLLLAAVILLAACAVSAEDALFLLLPPGGGSAALEAPADAAVTLNGEAFPEERMTRAAGEIILRLSGEGVVRAEGDPVREIVFASSEEALAALALSRAKAAPVCWAAAPGEYRALFREEDGALVPGVFATLCDDKSCLPLTADATGAVSASCDSFLWALHVLKLPEGYALNGPADFTFPAAGGTVLFTLTRIP